MPALDKMPRKIRIVLLTSAGVAPVGLLALLILTNAGSVSRAPLPNPNGYDDFLAAHSKINGDVGIDSSTLSRIQLQELVSTNLEALKLLRLGLSRTCSVPTAAAMTNISAMLSNLAQFKALAH